MPNLALKQDCTGCGACANACIKKCIRMEADHEGFSYPQVDLDVCVSCGLCERVCPIGHEKETDSLKMAYAAYHKDPRIRENSSSGGVFTAIAENVISRGGVVFGAYLDDQFRVVHGYTETIEGLEAFRGSKYVQSEIGDTYLEARTFLNAGRLVLFTGTPCQIGGLLGFLNKDYDNLICQDIICHGAPSPLSWKKYLAEQERKYSGAPVSVFFRDKTYGWSNFSMFIQFDNGKTALLPANKDDFMKAFLRDYCLRPSCYRCAFKQEARQADITLADFWGIGRIAPEMNDDRGTSLVLVHTSKGRALFEAVNADLQYQPVDWTASINLNPSMCRSVAVPAGRDRFMQMQPDRNFSYTVKKCCEPSAYVRLKMFAGKLRYLPNHILLKLLGKARYEKVKSVLKKG